MKIKLVTVEIKIDDELIESLYPHYKDEFDDIEDFTDQVYNSITTEDPESLKHLGYSVKIVKPMLYSLN